MNSKALREKREELIGEMRLLSERLTTEKRQSFTPEEREQFDNLDRQQEDMLAQAESLERVERVEGLSRSQSQAAVRAESLAGVSERAGRSYTEERNKAYAGWFYHGSKRQKPEYWRAAERQDIDVTSPTMRFDWLPWNREQRSGQVSSPGSAGGYLVAVDTSLMSEVDVALKRYGNIFEVATVVDTPTGAPLPWPTIDDTSNLAEITAENGTVGQTDMSFAQKQLSAYKYDSGFIKVSWELMNDSIIDLASFVGRMSGIRLGRKLNKDFVSGTAGVNNPTPLTLSATDSGVSPASATVLTYSELLGWFHSIDPAYRDEPGCAWMFADSFLQMLRGIVDVNGRPLLNSSLEGISGGIPAMRQTLFEKPYYVNQAVASPASSAKAGFFGDLSKIIIRRVSGGEEGGYNLVRLNEKFADTGQIAFLTWGRFDSLLSDAGTHPVRYITMHS